MVINDMIRFKQNLKGKAAEHVNYFYQVLKLNTYSAGLIRNFRNYNKCEGFYHYQALDYKEGMPLIKPYLKHSNIIIQSNANMAYISLSKNIMESFKEFPAKISFLNSIKIMDIFHEKKVPMPKNIDEWIATNNNSVTRLGLKTMVYYNYRNRSKEIIALLQKEDDVFESDLNSDSTLTNLVFFIMRDDGKIIAVFKPHSINEGVFNHIDYLIKEFSPRLNKEAYKVNGSESISKLKEKLGDITAEPEYFAKFINGESVLSKTIDESSFLSTGKPQDSMFNSNSVHVFDSKGNLNKINE